jgi:MFS family permease
MASELVTPLSPVAQSLRHDTTATTETVDWRTQSIILSGGALVTLALTGVAIVLPQIEAELAHGPSDRLLTKLLATIGGLTMVVGAPLGGFLVDRVGLRPVLITSCVLYAAAGTGGLYLNSLSALLVSRLVLGLSAAAMATMSMILINTRLRPDGRAKWMGRHIAAAMISGIVLTPIIGMLAEHGWRRPFALYALTLPLAWIAARIPEGRPIGTQVSAQKIAAPGSPKPDSLKGWFPLRYAVLAIIIGTVTFLPTVYIPFVIRGTGITSPTVISLVMLADSVIGAIMALLFARARRSLSHRAAFRISFSCASAGMLVVALSHRFAGVAVGMAIFGLALGWFIPNLMTAAARFVPLHFQGRATGLIKASFYLAAPVAVVAVEPITRRLGPQGAIWTVFAFAASTLAVLLATRGRKVDA